MKMKTNKFMTYALSAMMLGSLAACSSDDSEPCLLYTSPSPRDA